MNIYDIVIESPHDYNEIAMASLLETLSMYNDLERQQLIAESKWLIECMDRGYILPVTEAGNTPNTNGDKPKATIKDTFNKIIEALRVWFVKFHDRVLHDIAERARVYSDWAVENKEALIAGSEKLKSGLSVKPYDKGNWKQDATAAANAITLGINSLAGEKYDDFEFANNIVSSESVKNNDKDLSTFITNYFRFGEKNKLTSEFKNTTYVGNNLKTYAQTIIDYMAAYEKTAILGVDKINKAYNINKIKSIGNKMGVNESFDPNTKLSIEDRPICESMLTSLINYSMLLEAGENDTTNTNQTPKKDPNAEKEKEANSELTKVKSADGTDTTDKKDGEGDSTPKASNEAISYLKLIDNVTKMIFTGYARSIDERFVVYLTSLFEIAKAAGLDIPNKTKEVTNVAKGNDEEPKKETPAK